MIYSKIECESNNDWIIDSLMKVTDDVKPSIYEIRNNYFASEMIQIKPH